MNRSTGYDMARVSTDSWPVFFYSSCASSCYVTW